MTKPIRSIFLLTLFFSGGILCAQRSSDDESSHEWGFNLYVQANHVFYKPHGGDLAIGFPYHIDNRSGYFSGHVDGSGRGAGSFLAYGMEISHRDISFDVNVAPFSFLQSRNLSDGYIGMTWRCHYENFIPTMGDISSIIGLPLSFSIGVQDYNAAYRVGQIRIDTTERFKAFGANMGLSEDEQEHGFVNVLAEQMTFAVVPTVNLGYRPLLGNFQIYFRFGPFIPFYNKAGISFAYRDSDYDDGSLFPRIGVIPFKGYGIHATYNDSNIIPKNPFPIAGWMLSVRVCFGTPDFSRMYRRLY